MSVCGVCVYVCVCMCVCMCVVWVCVLCVCVCVCACVVCVCVHVCTTACVSGGEGSQVFARYSSGSSMDKYRTGYSDI